MKNTCGELMHMAYLDISVYIEFRVNLAVILEAPALILHCPVWVSVRLLHPDTNNVFVVLCIAGYVGNFSKMWWYWTTEFVISFPFHFCIAEKTYMFSSCGRLEAQTIRISGREGNLKSKMYPEDVPPPILKSKHPAFLGFRFNFAGGILIYV